MRCLPFKRRAAFRSFFLACVASSFHLSANSHTRRHQSVIINGVSPISVCAMGIKRLTHHTMHVSLGYL